MNFVSQECENLSRFHFQSKELSEVLQNSLLLPQTLPPFTYRFQLYAHRHGVIQCYLELEASLLAGFGIADGRTHPAAITALCCHSVVVCTADNPEEGCDEFDQLVPNMLGPNSAMQ